MVSELFRAFQRFLEVFRGFQRFSEVFRGFQRFLKSPLRDPQSAIFLSELRVVLHLIVLPRKTPATQIPSQSAIFLSELQVVLPIIVLALKARTRKGKYLGTQGTYYLKLLFRNSFSKHPKKRSKVGLRLGNRWGQNR